MLSYCACLFLAQYMHDKLGDDVGAEGKRRPDLFRGKIGVIAGLVDEFMAARAEALGVITGKDEAANACTPRTAQMTNLWFMSCA